MAVSVTGAILRQWNGLRGQLIDLLYPPRCVGCGQMDIWLCAKCLERAPRVEPPYCSCCGDAVAAEGLCSRCQKTRLHVLCIRAPFYFEGLLRDVLHRFKYQGLTALAPSLGSLMATYWIEHPMPADTIVPVPLHQTRLRDRGYNQAALLASEMAQHLRLNQARVEVDVRSLARKRATAPQIDLSADERKENVRGAFQCTGDTLTGKQVLLIDDVCTTGATLEACAVALYEGGVESVRALTLTRARYSRQERQSDMPEDSIPAR